MGIIKMKENDNEAAEREVSKAKVALWMNTIHTLPAGETMDAILRNRARDQRSHRWRAGHITRGHTDSSGNKSTLSIFSEK